MFLACATTFACEIRKRFEENQGKEGMLPHVAVVLRDCFLLEELPTFCTSKDRNQEDKVNLIKLMKLHKVVEDLQQCQLVSLKLVQECAANVFHTFLLILKCSCHTLLRRNKTNF